MLGATQAVDMIPTIDYSYGRVQVVVLSVERVPRKLDVVIGKRFYVVHLQVEGRDPDPAIDNMEVDDRDNDGHDKKGDEGNNNDTNDKGKKINDARSEQHKKKNSLTTTKEQQENGSKVNEALSVEEVDEFGEEFNMMRTSKYPNNVAHSMQAMAAFQATDWASDLHAGMREACGLPTEAIQANGKDQALPQVGLVGPALALQVLASSVEDKQPSLDANGLSGCGDGLDSKVDRADGPMTGESS
ncbi:hypothetical protein EJB05_33615, partial [Eragrostis curvula]